MVARQRDICRRRRFVNFIQNHDQVANSLAGLRGHQLTESRPVPRPDRPAPAGSGDADAVPGTGVRRLEPVPLLRRSPARAGQRWFAPGARSSWRSSRSLAGPEAQAALPEPADRLTFEALEARPRRARAPCGAYALHIDLLRLRREDPVFRTRAAAASTAPCIGPEAFVLRFFGVGLDLDDRLLCVNLGRDLNLPSDRRAAAGAPARARAGASSGRARAVRYGGNGTPPLNPAEGWLLPGHAAVVFGPSR